MVLYRSTPCVSCASEFPTTLVYLFHGFIKHILMMPCPAKYFRWVFYIASSFVLLDFFLNIIWLPIGAHNTWGFRTSEEAFLTTYNGTGAPPAWNWCLSYLATAGILIGFDASGHVAEETKNATITAARGIFWSTAASAVGGMATIILFLFCAVRFCPIYYTATL